MRCEQGHMRLWLLLSGVLASVANGSPGSAVVDLHGTARSGDRPEPRAIVWLDATDTAAPVAPAKPRLVARWEALRSRPVSGRDRQARQVRSPWPEPDLLQHPSEHGRLRDGGRHAALQRFRYRRTFHD